MLLLCLVISSVPVIGQTGGAIWEDGPVMNKTRIFPFVAQLDDNRNIIFGGREVGFISSYYSDIYDPFTNGFDEYLMNTPRDFPAVTPLEDGRFIIAGGSDDWGVAPGYTSIEFFNPSDNSFTLAGNMIYGRMQHSAMQLENGNVLIVGGWYSPDAAAYPEVFNPEAGTSSLTGALVVPRSAPVLLPTGDGGAIVLGGWPSYGGDMITTVEYYDPVSNAFTELSAEIFPSEPGWKVYGLIDYKPMYEKVMNTGKFLLKAFNDVSDLEYALIAFDPISKSFEKLVLQTTLMGDEISSYYDFVLNTDRTMAYLLSAYTDVTPYGMKIVSVDLITGEVNIPDDYFQLPTSHYYMGTLSWIPSQEKILMIGISTSPSDYFNATDLTMLITPEIKTTEVEAIDAWSNIILYPNPVVDQCIITGLPKEANVDEVVLIDVQGRMCRLQPVIEGQSNQWKINMGDLPSGVYVLRIGADYSQKILIQH